MSAPGHPLRRDLEHVYARTGGLLEELRGGRIFVTGGTGFVGRWMLESLLWASDEQALDVRVTVLSRHPEAFARRAPRVTGHEAVTMLEGDVTAFAFPTGEFGHVLHLAKEPGHDLSAAGEDAAALAPGTARVLAFAASHGTAKLLFTSSGAVYGRQPAYCERLSEGYAGAPSPDHPHAAYAAAKRAGELLCTSASYESTVRTRIARCFAIVGPYMDFDGAYAIGNFIRDAVGRPAVEVAGDGTPLRSYLYAADLAIWLWTILFSGETATPYNVGSPDPISIGDLAHLVARTVGGGKPVHIAQQPSRDPGAPSRYIPDTSRATSQLGLAHWVDLEDAIGRTTRWYRSTRLQA